jgi:hypothetical protein
VNAQRILAVRLDELLGWREALADPSLTTELHDMRIAAKRLRYALEMFDVCFADARDLAHAVADLQEDLGAIHDLDVLIARLRTRLEAGEPDIEDAATEIMGADLAPGEKQDRLRRLLSAQAHDRYRLGLVGLIGDKIAERRRRYTRVQRRWGEGGLAELSLRIQSAAGILADTTPLDQDQAPHAQATEPAAAS